MKHSLLGLMALLVWASCCGAASPHEVRRVVQIEKAAAAVLKAGRESNWQDYAELVHPEALKEFRNILAPVIRAAQKDVPQRQAQLLAYFEGAEDLDAVLAWEPKEYFVRFMKRVAAVSPDDKLRSVTAEIIGTVFEGSERAHVVVRQSRKVQGAELQKVSVVSLKRSDGEWKVFPTEWQEIAEAIRLSHGGQAVGHPETDAPDK